MVIAEVVRRVLGTGAVEMSDVDGRHVLKQLVDQEIANTELTRAMCEREVTRYTAAATDAAILEKIERDVREHAEYCKKEAQDYRKAMARHEARLVDLRAAKRLLQETP